MSAPEHIDTTEHSGTATTQRRHSICDHRGCRQPLHITIDPGQRWDDVQWQHADGPPNMHLPQPELRFAIDATCPICDYPEIGYSPALEQFVCSRCTHTQTARPEN